MLDVTSEKRKVMRILIIEDEQSSADRLRRMLEGEHEIVGTCASNAEVKDFFANSNVEVDLILSDIQLGDGLSFESLRTVPSAIPVIFTTNSYYTLMKGRNFIRLTKREKGQSTIVAEQPCKDKTVYLAIEADSMRVQFLIDGQPFGSVQSMRPLCDDGKFNKFNGLGVGIYATSTGKKTKAVATFQ